MSARVNTASVQSCGETAKIASVRELFIRQDIRRVANTLGLTFPLSKDDAANVARIVREKIRLRQRQINRIVQT